MKINDEIKIRCNQCGNIFEEDQLELFFEDKNGKFKEIKFLEKDEECYEIFKGCPNCKTDGYLMDIK